MSRQDIQTIKYDDTSTSLLETKHKNVEEKWSLNLVLATFRSLWRKILTSHNNVEEIREIVS
jgi:hypothetical protein